MSVLWSRGPYASHVAIDASGRWWRGETFDDLDAYIREYTAEGYPATVIRQCRCECGGTVFGLRGDQDEGCARRTCRACGSKTFIADNAEFWVDAEPRTSRCPCKGLDYELGVGFSMRDDGGVRWITVGQRCVACGVLASFVDWKIDYEPSVHLVDQA